jgi:hypothetical protein
MTDDGSGVQCARLLSLGSTTRHVRGRSKVGLAYPTDCPSPTDGGN